ncbi:hypothetical protein IAR55_002840 [Kwoniella newhampshirensis]|uniref:SH3 domain-containing protein n=1 Tax=Kwoniella newhampshirensis TaxID=1651941 RepID=A0AAW0YP51_9TREE
MSFDRVPTIPSFLISTILAFVPTAIAASSAPSTLPRVDYSKMGNVGLGGAFSGLDWWTSPNASSSPSSSSSTTTTTFSSEGDTVFYRSADGTFHPLGSTNSGGLISSICWSNATSANGTLYIGGVFSSLAGTSATNVASYSLDSSSFSALGSGLQGPVNTLYCDNNNDQIWFGGSFAAPTGTGGNVAVWSTSSSSWVPPGFGGLNGVVESITPSANGSSLYFGGDFTTTFVSNSSSLLNTTSSTNGTAGNVTSIPSAPENTTTVGRSGYLTPLTISAGAAPPGYQPSVYSNGDVDYDIQAGPSTTQSNYSNPDVLLCPGSGDWLAQDNTVANLNLFGQSDLSATGIRVVNGLIEGRGTKYFCITIAPEWVELNMTYTDPKTGKNETCQTHCPLYTDPTISGQDFIFTDGTQNFTGFEMQLKEWIGDGVALSSVALLTDGAYASAGKSDKISTCSAGRKSTVQTVGDWRNKTVSTDSSTNYYLSSSISTNNPTSSQVTFYPYVSSAGNYDIYIVIPGCIDAGDCRSRTSVDIEVFPLQGGLGWTSTISEQVDYDTKSLVYSGPVDATSDSFTPTVSLALAANPAPVSSGSRYTVVADRIQLSLTGVSGSSSSSSTTSSVNGTTTTGVAGTNVTTSVNSTEITNSSYSVAYGVFEWSRSSRSNINAATSFLSNNTETPLTRLGFSLDAALNASGSAASSWVVNTIVSIDNTIFVGGDFSASNNYTNVLSIDGSSGQAAALASQGLSGIVNAAAVVNGYVFFGGDFTSTASSGGVALNYIARYDPRSKAWAALGGGVDGYVTDLLASTVSSTQLVVLGNFTRIVSSNGTSTQSGGYAIWDTSSSSWANTGVVYGNVSAGAVPASSSSGIRDQSFFAGKVYGYSSNSVSGVATLSSDSDGTATIASLDGVSLGSSGSSPSTSSTASQKGSMRNRSSFTRTWLSRFTDAIIERASPVLAARATAPTIVSEPAPAPAVLAGAFWTNSSASGRPTITILGGNFSASSSSGGNVEGVAFYKDGQNGLTGPSPSVGGVVRTLNVIGNKVYVGGEGVTVDGVGNGLVVYDLERESWMTGGMPSLNPASGMNVTVNAIRKRQNTNTVVVAGNFATAGSLGCASVCLWDSGNAQWSTPGSGLSSGEVRAVDFAGDSYETLIAAGSFSLSTGEVAYVASYSFSNSSWTALGTLPGPALAIAVDDKNVTNIFAAGYSSSDGTPYLQQWNGVTWSSSPQNDSLQTGSTVQQLVFVPMSDEHTPHGSIENDRMLMVSGDLYLEDSGNVTSALYDGANWYPYLVATSSTGGLGAASSLFWSESSFSFSVRHYLARGLVVLVAIAIATGLILLFVLLALLIAYCPRRKERKNAAEQRELYEKNEAEGGSDGDVSSTHQHVFNNVQAALEASLVGGGLVGAGTGAAAAARAAEVRRSDPSSYESGAYPIGSDAEHGGEEEEEEDEGRETTMRYDFSGPELQEGELSMRAGQMVIILDDEQSHEWWYARDPATGREGVIPATYVW